MTECKDGMINRRTGMIECQPYYFNVNGILIN